MDVSQVVGFALAQAKWVGAALLAAGIAIRLVGRALARVLLAAGILAAAALAYQEWLAVHSVLVSGGLLLGGIVVFGLLAWTVRGLSFLFAFVVIAAAFYLLLVGWAGVSFVGTTTGSLVWAGGTILTMIVTGLRGSLARRVPVAAVGAAIAH